MRFARLHYILFFVLFTLTALAGPKDHYNEVYDETGKPRPGYREVLPAYESLSEQQKKKIRRQTLKDFQGDNALSPIPRVITREDHDLLQAGIRQRGTALRMFLQDYFSGNDKVIEKLIPKDVFERIIERSGDIGFRRAMDPKNISFPYGPDLMRAPDGSWRVIEDNHGYVGGFGDLVRARESLYKNMPDYVGALPVENSPERFYKDMVDRFRKLAKPPGGKIVILADGPGADNEDRRLNKLFKELGVDYVSPNTKQKIYFDKDGAWVKEAGKRRQRVGYIFLNGEHAMLDGSNRVSYGQAMANMIKKFIRSRGEKLDEGMRFVLEDAIKIDPKLGTYNVDLIETALEFTGIPNAAKKKLDKSMMSGMVDAMLKGKVATSYTPGLEFLSDKEFYVYVDEIVRHYSGEEPILKNLPTEKFTSKDGRLRKALVEKVMKNKDRYVIKSVDGRGGDSVWVGPKVKKAEFEKVRKLIESEPERFIVQEYTPLSTVDDLIVDIRGLSIIDTKGAVVADSYFARGLPKSGDGKVNLSANGQEMTVLVVDPKKIRSCSQQFSSMVK